MGCWRYAKGGFVNNYVADEGIKIPSIKETLDIYRKSGVNMDLIPDKETLESLKNASLHWGSNYNPYNMMFFSELKSRGYNGVLDMNDVGKIGTAPLRILDGSSFHISGSDVLTPKEISKAIDDYASSNLIMKASVKGMDAMAAIIGVEWSAIGVAAGSASYDSFTKSHKSVLKHRMVRTLT